jgi:hypothetical protein
MLHEHFRAALESCDVALVRKMWNSVFPNMPQPKSDEAALAQIHYARTLMPIGFDLRAYSHCWLLERALPSGLPDEFKPSAQRLYPVTVGVVGISVNATSEIGRRLAPVIQSAMSDAVMDAYAEGKTEPTFIRARMQEARTTTVRRMIG